LKKNNNKSCVPTLKEEQQLYTEGFQLIAGIDEVGRGALAGPVVAAAVILPKSVKRGKLRKVRDSKELTPEVREMLFNPIMDEAVAVGIGIVSAEIIDSINILKATWMAMRHAIQKLRYAPDFLLIDGTPVPHLDIPQKGIIKGDRLCLSIACASIIAKVARDRIMVEVDSYYPNYGLAEHKGYGTEEHIISLNRYGACAIHRFTFAPVKETVRLL
jgi:ribonuclease HII